MSWYAPILRFFGIGQPPPEFPGSKYRSPQNKEVHMPRSDEAVQLVRQFLIEKIGKDLPTQVPRVRWFQGDPLTFKGITLKVHGIYRQGHPGEIQIGLLPSDDKPSARALLAHEMGHWARYHALGDGDANHEDKAWWSNDTLITQKLREKGL